MSITMNILEINQDIKDIFKDILNLLDKEEMISKAIRADIVDIEIISKGEHHE